MKSESTGKVEILFQTTAGNSGGSLSDFNSAKALTIDAARALRTPVVCQTEACSYRETPTLAFQDNSPSASLGV